MKSTKQSQNTNVRFLYRITIQRHNLNAVGLLWNFDDLDDARELAQDGLQHDSIEGADWESQLICAYFCELLSQLEAKARDLEQSAAYFNESLSLYGILTAHEGVGIPADSIS